MSFFVHVLAMSSVLAMNFLLRAPDTKLAFWKDVAGALMDGREPLVTRALPKLELVQQEATEAWQRARAWTFARFFGVSIVLALCLRASLGLSFYSSAFNSLCASLFYVLLLQSSQPAYTVRRVSAKTA